MTLPHATAAPSTFPGSKRRDGSFPSSARRFVGGLLEPISREKRGLLQERWRELPDELRTPNQVVGQQLIHCGYTMGPAYCSFGCTHCYLPPNANRAPLPTLSEMKRQIDANRRLLGPDGPLQLTGGDVLDAYWKADRADELVEILAYAAEVGVVSMLMTHGQVLLDQPDYFDRLVVEGRLRKVAIHIDITQAGRPGYPIKQLTREADLHPLRAEFVDLIHGVRRRTGARSLTAAHTVTVTERNIASIHEIFAWLTADPRRTRAFRMISLQPEADVGRTRYSKSPVTPETTWAEVCKALDTDLARDNLSFGHPDCSNLTTVLVRPGDRKVVNTIPADDRSREFWSQLLRTFGGVGSRGWDHARANGQRIGILLRRPFFVARALGYAFSRMREERVGPGFLLDLARGRVAALNIVQHNFMSDEQLRDGGELIEQRLAACSFRGAVERDGEWVAVPMCSMNVEEREGIYERDIEREQIETLRSLPVVA